NHIERICQPKGTNQRRELQQRLQPARTASTTEIVNRRADELVDAGFRIVTQNEDMDLMPARQAFDEPQQHRNHAFAAAPIDTAGDDERDAHQGPAATSLARRAATSW